MHILDDFNIDIIGGQIMSRVSAKGKEEEGQAIKVVVPKSISADGLINIDEMPEEIVVKDLDQKRITEVGDIVVKLSTPYGAGIVEEESAGCIVPSFCAIVKSTGDLDPLYLLAFLNSEYCKEQIQAQVTGSVMTVISVGKIKKLMLPVPTIEEQHEIGNRFVETKRKLQIMKKIVSLEEERNNIVFEELARHE